jgi:hypothetical protein
LYGGRDKEIKRKVFCTEDEKERQREKKFVRRTRKRDKEKSNLYGGLEKAIRDK